jgi:hypothetical protein
MHFEGAFGHTDWDRVKILAENGLRAGKLDCLPLLGASLAELGDWTGAQQQFEEGIIKGALEARSICAYFLVNSGFHASVVDVLKNGALDDPDDLDLGVLLMEKEETFAQAGEYLAKSLYMERGQASLILARWYLLQGLANEAEKWLDNVPTDSQCLKCVVVCLGELRMMQGRIEEAAKLLDLNAQSVPVEFLEYATTLLGDLCLIRGECETALSYFRREGAGSHTKTIARHFVDPVELCAKQIAGLQGSDRSGTILAEIPFVGDFVIISGLASAAGKQLNGQIGTVTSWDHFLGRIGVRIDGVTGLKAIKLMNLVLLGRPASIEQEELHDQVAIEASLKMSGVTVHPELVSQADVNAQISDALLRSRQGPKVMLITCARRCSQLIEFLKAGPELKATRLAMQANGLTCQSNEGGRLGPFVFVQPDNYHPLEEALRLSGFPLSEFRCGHVFAEEDLAEVILKFAQSIPKADKLRPTSAIVPLSFAAKIVENNLEARTFKTFIDIKVPTSMWSEGSGTKTMSTTATDPRKGPSKLRPCARNNSKGSS